MSRGAVRSLVVTIGLMLPMTALAAMGPEISDAFNGRSVPDIEAETIDGRTFTLEDLGRRPVLINFFASWCTVCQAENVALRDIQANFASRGLRVVGVNSPARNDRRCRDAGIICATDA